MDIDQEFSEVLCDFTLASIMSIDRHEREKITNYVFDVVDNNFYHADVLIYLCLRALGAVLTFLSDECLQKGIPRIESCKKIEKDIFREMETEGKGILENGEIDIENLISKIEDALFRYKKEQSYPAGLNLAALLSLLYIKLKWL